MESYVRMIICIFLGGMPGLNASVPDCTKVEALRASVIIPCHSVHAVHLEELLHSLEKQTMRPWEVVIALSDLAHVPKNVLRRLEKSLWAFPVTLITSNTILYAGQNRNLACRYAHGDVLICQDADDIPHPQRIEIITYFFTRYEPDLIVHTYACMQENRKVSCAHYADFNAIKWVNPESFDGVAKNAIVNGNIAAKKEVLEKYKWPSDKRGQDVKFNRMLFNAVPHRILIYAPLYVYRKYLSSVATVAPDAILSVIERSYNADALQASALQASALQADALRQERYSVMRIINDV